MVNCSRPCADDDLSDTVRGHAAIRSTWVVSLYVGRLPAERSAYPLSFTLLVQLALCLVVVEAWWSLILVGVVLVRALVIDIMLVIHLFGTLFRVLVSLVSIPGVFTLGLSQLVDFPSNKSSEELFCKCMRHRFAWKRVSTINWASDAGI